MDKGITLEARKAQFEQEAASHKHRIIICAGTACIANGALNVYKRLLEVSKTRGLSVDIILKKEEGAALSVSQSGCQGFCQMGPLVKIYPQGILYTKTKATT